MSKGEEKIISLLRQARIPFKREVTFYDLKRKDNLRFDFAIYKNNQLIGIIEYDGEQHFHQVKHFQKTKKDFQKTQEYDRIKNSYCLAHNIPLYRIPYTEIDNITSANDLLQQKFRVKSKWHNDFLVL